MSHQQNSYVQPVNTPEDDSIEHTTDTSGVWDIGNGLLSGVTYTPSPNHGGSIKPRLIVIHYTAAGPAAGSIEWLCDRSSNASAHVVIARSGEITQLVPFDKKAWHAGRSSWNGKRNVNQFSVGIELANWGLLTKNDSCKSWSGMHIPWKNVKMAAHKSDPGLTRFWERYTGAQLKLTLMLCRTLVAHYHTITDVVGHDDVSPGRKLDPGPAFPMSTMRCLLFGRKEALT